MQAAARQARAACRGGLPRLAGLQQLRCAASLGAQPSSQPVPCVSKPWSGVHLRSQQPARSVCTEAAAAAGRKKKLGWTGAAPGPTPLVVSPDRPIVILGIDPDASGALAVVQWGATTPRCANGLPASLADAAIAVHDMPMETVAVGKRGRRQADAAAIAVLLHELLPSLADKAEVHVVLEQPVPNALNGKFSWFQTGYAYGVWNGVLAAYSMRMQTISALRWKRDMHLHGKGKEGSRQLALALYPQAADQLKRKKDHGRAEALLIAAWASGIELPEEAFETLSVALEAVAAVADAKVAAAEAAAAQAVAKMQEL